MVFAALVIFPLLMAYAAFSDLFTMTISNYVSLALVIGFFLMAILVGMPAKEISFHAAAGVAMLTVTFIMFARGWIGGGDAKLAAATALWMGFDQLPDYSLCASALGGLLTLMILIARRYPLPALLIRQPWIARLHEKGHGVPYGIALAIAGVIIYPQTGIWLSAVTR